MLRQALILLAVALGCGDRTPPQPSRDPQPAPAPTRGRFVFEPTMLAHRPQGAPMELIAEAGDAAKGTLSLIVAHHDGSRLSLALWSFDSTGEDDTVVPASDPEPLLALREGDTTDVPALESFRQTRSASHNVATRPQGIGADDAATALQRLHEHAATALDEAQGGQARVEALAAFTRGLDDGLLFRTQGLADALALLGADGRPRVTDGSARRVTATWGEGSVSMLRKAEGWTVDSVD